MPREDAVSSTMAVTLMLAIVVVLAAVALVMTRSIGQTEESTPALSFQRSESDDSLRIPRATHGADWSEFQIRTTSAVPGLVVDINDAANIGDQAVTTSLVTIGSGAITGGDRLYFCATSEVSSVRVLIVHEDTNENIYDATFLNIGAC